LLKRGTIYIVRLVKSEALWHIQDTLRHVREEIKRGDMLIVGPFLHEAIAKKVVQQLNNAKL
jgi:hypothetical protein